MSEHTEGCRQWQDAAPGQRKCVCSVGWPERDIRPTPPATSGLTDAERESLWGHASHAALVAAIEAILTARLTEQAERIATAMREEFADRIEWGDGTQFIATDDAARIARNHGAAS